MDGTGEVDPSADEPSDRGIPSSHRLLFETTPDPVVVADAESGTLLAVNDATVDLLGYSKAELRGEPITHLHPTGAEEAYRQLFDRHVKSAEAEAVTTARLPSGGQIYVENRSGEEIPVEINARVFDLDGRTVISGIFRDITARKERERELETFEAVVENAGHSVYWTDQEGIIEYVNPAFEEQTGFSREEAEGSNPRILQSGEHDEEFYAETWNAILGGAVWHGELVNERKDGSRLVVDQTIAPVESPGDGPDRFVAINTDISERRERERELREFRKVVEQAGLAVFMTDTDGTIEYVNPAFEEITGYDRDEAVGRNPRILKSGEKDEAYYEELWEAILGGDTWEEEIVNRRADGTTYHALQTITSLTDEEGEPVKLVAIQRDVTDIKEFEAELERQNERLERFASVVSHDLRNPLNVAKGRLDLALDDTENDHLQAIDRSLDRMETLIEDLLDLARDGDTPMAVETVSLSDVVTESWQQVDTAEARLRIETSRRIRADTRRLRRLFENLFRNAVEHGSTSPRSQAREDAVEHSSTSPRSQTHEDAVEHGSTGPGSQAHENATEQYGEDVTVTVGDREAGFYVEDDGPGIPEDERRAVFESGYSTGDGTGFGLSIVSRTAEAHDWDVSITEGVTGGARFEFTGVTSE